MKKNIIILIISAFTGISCSSQKATNNINLSLSDKKATTETKALYRKLNTLSKKGFLFGHQDDLAYGVKWKYENGRSDVKETAGDYPAVYGWDIAGLENDSSSKRLLK